MESSCPRMGRRATPALLVLLTVLCVLGLAPSAWAAPGNGIGVSIDPPNPVAGDMVTATGSSVDCPATYTFAVTYHNPDGTTTPASTPRTSTTNTPYSFTVPKAGTYTVTEDTVSASPNCTQQFSDTFTVGEGLGGSIDVSPDPPVRGQTATLGVTPTGGNQGYTYAWDIDNRGTFTAATTATFDYTFTTSGPHTVKVRITDNSEGNNARTHTAIITRTINVVEPTPGAPPPPPPPTCYKTVDVKLSEFTTTGCFTKTSSSPAPDRWETRSAVKLNGIPLPAYGQRFIITGPTDSEKGGHFTALNSTMKLDRFTAFAGNIDWSLPDGKPGDKAVFRTFSVAAGANLLGLNVRGSIALELGEDTNGYHYATFPLTIELPVSFKAGPEPGFGSVTGSASLKVDDKAIHYDGLKLEANNVWLGKLKVISTCFSFVPSGGKSVAPCATPTFGGRDPFIECKQDTGTNRWDASAEVQLPSSSEFQVGAFGGLADGRVSKLGGSIGNLGRRVPLANGVYLDHIAFGLCLSPPPFKIKADVGANFLDRNVVSVDGNFTYTDATESEPWSVQLTGGVTVGDTEAGKGQKIGSGTLGISPRAGIDFDVQAGINALDVASINGEVSGWIDAPNGQYSVSGDVNASLGDIPIVRADGMVSNIGIAGCLSSGFSLPTYNLIIPLDGSPVYLDTQAHPLFVGFGYRWNASTVDMLGGACDFSAYQPTRVSSARAVAAQASIPAAIPVQIAGGTKAVSLRIHGTHGPPKVVLHGPNGSVITSPARRRGELVKGHYLLVENKTNATTNVALMGPAAGTWTVSRAPGSASSPTSIDRANFEAPPTIGARVTARGGWRTVQVAYAVPVGASVTLVERAKGITHRIAATLRGHACRGSKPKHADGDNDADDRGSALPRMRPGTDERILCATVRFRPSRGPGGTRKVQAIVTRRGIPLAHKDIAFFQAPPERLPSRIGVLQVRRDTGSLLIAFPSSRGASRYAASAKLSDGRELAFDLGGRCRALRITNVPRGVGAKVMIAGVRYDLAVGRRGSISIKANAGSAGPRKLRLGKVCT